MHLVGILFQPVEEAFDSVPDDTVPVFISLPISVSAFAIDDDILMALGEFVEWFFGRTFQPFTGSFQVSLAFAVDLSFERTNQTLFDTEISIWNRQSVIDFDNPSESAAFGTGTDR